MDFPDLTPIDAPSAETPDLTAPGNPPPMAENVVQQKARRADFAMGDQSPGTPALADAFNSGKEGAVRSQVAGQARAEFQQARLDHIKSLVYSKTPITAGHIDGLMHLGGDGPGSNPDTSIEDKFGQNYVAAGVVGEPEKNLVFQSAFENAPEETNRNVQVAQAMVSRHMQAKNLLEDSQAAYDQIPIFNLSEEGKNQQDKSGEFFSNLVTLGLGEYAKQRNLVTGDKVNTSILPGSNKLEQIQALYLLPQDQFLPTLRAVAGPGSKLWKEAPGSAMDFLRAAVSFAPSDAYVDNAFAIANVASMLPVGSGLRAIGRLVNGREVTSAALQSGLQAAQDVLRSSSAAPKAALSEGGQAAASTAEDVLKGSSTPLPQKYYVPGAAIERRNWEGTTETSGAQITPNFSYTVDQKTGKPTIYNAEGIPVDLTNTPEVGHYPVSVEKQPNVNTYTTSHGTFEHTPEGVIRGPGLEPQKTIYVSKADSEKLSQVLDEDKNSRLLSDEKGNYFVNDVDQSPEGKPIRGSQVPASRISDTPKEGLYPVHIPEGNDQSHFMDFGTRITRVDENGNYKLNFGNKIAPTADVEARKALSDIVKSAAETEPQDALTVMGQQESAAQIGASRDLGQAIRKEIPKTADDMRRVLPSIFSPQQWFHNASSLSRELAQRIQQRAQEQSDLINRAISDPVRVERLSNEALATAVQKAKDDVKADPRWNRNSDAILDQQHHYDASTNTYRVETKFGQKDGTLFDTSAQAENYLKEQYKLDKAGATVQQEGNKFYISHLQDIDETYRPTRDGLIISNETPHGAINTFLNWLSGKAFGGLGPSLRSSRYTLSAFQSQQRVVATHGSTTLGELIQRIGEPLQALSKNERQELGRVLENNRDYWENGQRGTFYKSAEDFEQGFFNIHNKMPSAKQTEAYDTFVRLNDLDWMLRAFQAYRDRSRLGIRNYAVTLPVKDANGLVNNVKTDFFNGKKVDNFGVTKQNANVYVIPQSRMTEKFEADTPLKRELNDKIKSGEWNVIQVANPREKPLQPSLGYKDDVHFIVTDAFEDKPITLGEGVTYNPGGHVINRDPYFLKVPIIGKGHNGKDTHFGDLTFKSFATEREANTWADRYNTAREHLLNNRNVELQDMFDKGMFPETLPEFKRQYTTAGINADTKMPFVVTKDARTTLQSSQKLRDQFPGLAEQWDSYNLTQAYNKDFLAERDQVLNTITGKEGQWENTASRLYDPYTSLQRGLQQIGNERWMGDYKTQAAENWVSEFWHLFPQDTLPREKLEQNPWYWVYHAKGNLDAGLTTTNPDLYTAAMVSRQNIINFLGARSEAGGVLAGMERKVLDFLEPKLGTSATAQLETNVLPFIKDVPTYIRRAAFNAVDGLFNPVQLIQQAQDMGRVLAISPASGLHGITASVLARLYRYTEDPAILSSLFDKAAKLGWNRDHIEEAFNAWKRSGVHTIGGEQAMLNDVANPTIFVSGIHRFLDKGQLFFKAGERMNRDTAFFTSYLDWRKANPNAELTNRSLGDIMNRWDTMTGNMTRASNAAYNEGLLSIPTQFWNWNLRLTEQMMDGGFLMTGRQLTAGEKARILTMYSAMYGIPATIGGATFGGFGVIPYANYDDVRQYALAHGYNVNNKYFEALSEGVLAMLTNIVTGHHTDFQRFSANANQLTDITEGKKSGWQAIIGASGGFAGNVANSLYPFAKFAMSALSGHPDEFPLKWADVKGVLQNISSFSNEEKMRLALTTGKLWSKNNQMIDNQMDTFESLMAGLGLNPKRDSDTFQMKNYLRNLQGDQDKMRPLILNQWNQGLDAAAKGDMASATDFFTRAKALSSIANFSMKDAAKLRHQAIQGANADLVDQAELQWRKNLPTLRSIPALKQYLDNLNKHYK